MTPASNDLNNLTSDIAHLATLIGVTTHHAIEHSGPTSIDAARQAMNDLSDLLWIARDMVDQIAKNADACHTAVVAARKGEAR